MIIWRSLERWFVSSIFQSVVISSTVQYLHNEQVYLKVFDLKILHIGLPSRIADQRFYWLYMYYNAHARVLISQA